MGRADTMTRPVRWAIALGTVVSVLLCAIVVFLWIASYGRWDSVWVRLGAERGTQVCSDGGRVVLVRDRSTDQVVRRFTWLSGGIPNDYPAYVARERALLASVAGARERLPQPDPYLDEVGIPTTCTNFSLAGFELLWGRNSVGRTLTLFIIVPHWMVLVPLSALPALRGAMAIRSRRRKTAGLCAQCGYDLTGNVTGVCSECGTLLPEPDSLTPGKRVE